jgi:hypothetical protein
MGGFPLPAPAPFWNPFLRFFAAVERDVLRPAEKAWIPPSRAVGAAPAKISAMPRGALSQSTVHSSSRAETPWMMLLRAVCTSARELFGTARNTRVTYSFRLGGHCLEGTSAPGGAFAPLLGAEGAETGFVLT